MDEALPLWLRVRRTLGRTRRRFHFDPYDVFVRPVPESGTGPELPEGYIFRWATPADIEGCDEYHTDLDERERREGAKRLGFGHKAVVVTAREGGPIVFSMWVNPRNLNVPGMIKRRLGAHQSFIYKAFTSPDHRGQKLYGAGMQYVLADMAREGKTELVGYAHTKKRISRKGLARLRFESVGRAYQLFVPGWQRTYVTKKLASYFPEKAPRSGVMTAEGIAQQ